MEIQSMHVIDLHLRSSYHGYRFEITCIEYLNNSII